MKKSTSHIFITLFLLLPLYFLTAQNLKVHEADSTAQTVIDSVSYKRTHKNIKSIVDELEKLQKSLFRLGYFDTTYSDIEKINDSTYKSNFSIRKKYNTLKIYYDAKSIRETLLDAFTLSYTESYFIISPENIEPFLETLVTDYQNNGNPFAEVQLADIFKYNNTLEAYLAITLQEKRTIDKIIIKGYEKFPQSYVKHYLKLTSKRFNKNEITSQTKKINQLSFARQLKDPELLFTKDSTILYIYLEKVRSNYFDGFIGFNSDEDTGNLKLNGYVDLKLNNNLNSGEQFSILWKNDGNKQTNFLADLKLPYLFNSPIGINASLNIFKRDSLFTTVDMGFKALYQINPNNQVHLGIQQTESNNLQDNNTSFLIDDYKSFFTTAGYSFIIRNTAFSIFQHKANIIFEGSTGNRKNNNEINRQNKLFFESNYLWELNNRNFIYINNTSEALFSNNYLTNEKLRLGGIQSIRGFNENSLEATLYSTLNTEYRYLLSQNSYIHSIVDFAYIQDKLLNVDRKLYGFGFGLGIRSKSGLLKINYAVGKTDNSTIRLSESKVHISLSTTF